MSAEGDKAEMEVDTEVKDLAEAKARIADLEQKLLKSERRELIAERKSLKYKIDVVEKEKEVEKEKVKVLQKEARLGIVKQQREQLLCDLRRTEKNLREKVFGSAVPAFPGWSVYDIEGYEDQDNDTRLSIEHQYEEDFANWCKATGIPVPYAYKWASSVEEIHEEKVCKAASAREWQM